jgi:hypothetical protein
MNFASQERADATRVGQEMFGQYQTVLEGWAEVSKCCMEAADDIYKTSIDYMKDQTEQFQEISRDPSAAMREQTVSKVINCSFDAADRIAQAYLHSLETVREPLMRAVSAQLPMGRTMSSFMERSLQTGMEAMERGTDQMERSMRSATKEVERGARETQSQQHQQHGKRKSA